MYESIGLVLSGGGAKGAYEVGVFQALEKFCIAPYIGGIVGASVGALNAVLFETCNDYYEVWESLKSSDLLNLDNKQAENFREQVSVVKSHISGLIDRARNPEKENTENTNKLTPEVIKKYLPAYADLASKGLPFSQDKISALIDRKVDFNKIRREIVVTCTRMNLQFQTESFYLNDYSNDIKKQIVLASSAYPAVYCGTEGIEISGHGRFFDGGFRAKGNTPVAYLPEKYRKAVVVHLKNTANTSIQYDIPNENIVHIVPSRSLGSTLYLEPHNVKNSIALGFSDTIAKLDDIEKLIK